jgi:3-methyladenine DNA glycosylase AlkD
LTSRAFRDYNAANKSKGPHMNAQAILDELKSLGDERNKRVLLKHGAREPFFGVKIGDLKKIQKRVKKDHQLALELYDSGVSDAMYLAGLIADPAKMTKKDLERWVSQASWSMIDGYAVPWVASESKHGWELGLKWIESKKENVAVAGWGTLSSLVSIKDDDELDVAGLKKLLQRVATTIHAQPDRVRYMMNSFVIAVGCYVKPLTTFAVQMARQIGKVEVDMNGTACEVPAAPDYINKVKARGTLGKKRKTAKC